MVEDVVKSLFVKVFIESWRLQDPVCTQIVRIPRGARTACVCLSLLFSRTYQRVHCAALKEIAWSPPFALKKVHKHFVFDTFDGVSPSSTQNITTFRTEAFLSAGIKVLSPWL